jgi:hypothetical protein
LSVCRITGAGGNSLQMKLHGVVTDLGWDLSCIFKGYLERKSTGRLMDHPGLGKR